MGDCAKSKKSSNKKQAEPALLGWTKDEKYDLLQCIKTVGSHNIQAIQKTIRTKTPNQIKSAIEYYKKLAFKSRDPRKGGRPRIGSDVKPSLPLSHWAKLLTDKIAYKDLQTEIATALRLIAEFEAIPQVSSEYVDFKKAYHMLANAVEGKDLEEDKFLTMLITKSIVETALTSKVFLQNTTVKQIVANMVIKTDEDVKSFAKPGSTKELGIVEYLADQRNYNPMNISLGHLRADKD